MKECGINLNGEDIVNKKGDLLPPGYLFYQGQNTHRRYKMKNDSPFAIRLELLKMAQQQLQCQYGAENDLLRAQWEYDAYHKQQEVPQSQRAVLSPLQAPKYPTEVEIIALATRLNDFISNTK